MWEKVKFKEPVSKRKRMFPGESIQWGQSYGEVKLAKDWTAFMEFGKRKELLALERASDGTETRLGWTDS